MRSSVAVSSRLYEDDTIDGAPAEAQGKDDLLECSVKGQNTTLQKQRILNGMNINSPTGYTVSISQLKIRLDMVRYQGSLSETKKATYFDRENVK